ncbi:hypothetical protein TNCV_158071 [Trichonephila clavipes]|nr:hypothetical protein TNCV_158071 [Trichonephila clavipes]
MAISDKLGITQKLSSLGFMNDSKKTEMSVDVTIQIAPELQRRIKTDVQKKQAECSIRPVSPAICSHMYDRIKTFHEQTFRTYWCVHARRLLRCVPLMSIHFLQCDEAHFWLNGYINKQNCHIRSEANPQVYVETPLHPEKLTVWCVLWAGGILLQKR